MDVWILLSQWKESSLFCCVAVGINEHVVEKFVVCDNLRFDLWMLSTLYVLLFYLKSKSME